MIRVQVQIVRTVEVEQEVMDEILRSFVNWYEETYSKGLGTTDKVLREFREYLQEAGPGNGVSVVYNAQ